MNYLHFYMMENGASEKEASNHLKNLIRNSWKKLNKAVVEDSTRVPAIVKLAVNVTRCAHGVYEYGDWFGIQSKNNQYLAKSILQPIPMNGVRFPHS